MGGLTILNYYPHHDFSDRPKRCFYMTYNSIVWILSLDLPTTLHNPATLSEPLSPVVIQPGPVNPESRTC